MSRRPAFSPSNFLPNQKINRLRFPHYGDPFLYDRCGRKHFQQNISPDNPLPPFIAYQHQPRKVKLQHPEQASYQKRQSDPFAPTNRYVFEVPREQNKPRVSEPTQKEVLDQQVADFNLKIKLRQHRKMFSDRGRQKRVHTEQGGEPHMQNNLAPKLPPIQRSQTRARIKTDEPLAMEAQFKPRFNPTFLSSIHY